MNLTEERIDVGFVRRSGELQKGPERECLTKLRKIQGLFVIEHNPVNLSFATGSNFPSTRLHQNRITRQKMRPVNFDKTKHNNPGETLRPRRLYN